MLRILLILIIIAFLAGCAARQISPPEPDERWPQLTPDWVSGTLKKDQFLGISKPTLNIQKAFRDAYMDAIRQIASSLGTVVEARDVERYAVRHEVYDPEISRQLKTSFRHMVKGAHTVENYMERRRGLYTVYILVECDAEQIAARLSRLPRQDSSALNHAIRQLMYSLMAKAESARSAEIAFWQGERRTKIESESIPEEVGDVLRGAIDRTRVLTLMSIDSDAEAVLNGKKYKTTRESVTLTLNLNHKSELMWFDTATGVPYRSKWVALIASAVPSGGQHYIKKRRWLTAVQAALGIAWAWSWDDYRDKREYYERLRGVSREELNAAYKDTVRPNQVRAWFGAAFGGLWLLNTAFAVYDAGQYQEQRQQFELESSALSLNMATPGEIRLSRRF